MAVLYDGVRLRASRSKGELDSGAVCCGGEIGPDHVVGNKCMLCLIAVDLFRLWKRLLWFDRGVAGVAGSTLIDGSSCGLPLLLLPSLDCMISGALMTVILGRRS